MPNSQPFGTMDFKRVCWNQSLGNYEPSPPTILLNLRGTKFEIHIDHLEKFPSSKLGAIADFARNSECNLELCINRNPVCFGAILDYFETGLLHYPQNVCGVLFRRELAFWGIEEKTMQKCCMNDYTRSIETEEKLRYFTTYMDRQGMTKEETTCENPVSRCRFRLWNVMTKPNNSKAALYYCFATNFLLLCNVIVIIMQSVYTRRVSDIKQELGSCRNFLSILADHTLLYLFYVDAAFSIFFSLEIIIRSLVAPTFKAFFTSMVLYIEILSLAPFYLMIYIIVTLHTTKDCPELSLQLIRTMFTLRVIRVFRIFASLRFYRIFNAFMYTIKSSRREIFVLFMLVAITTVMMGTLTTLVEYAYVEDDEKMAFKNILTGFWWAIITATTVGYGDVVPDSPVGRLMTVIVALSGIAVIALATPMVSANFHVIHTYLSGQDALASTQNDVERVAQNDDGKVPDYDEEVTSEVVDQTMFEENEREMNDVGNVGNHVGGGGVTNQAYVPHALRLSYL